MICEGVTDTLSAHELGRPAIGLTGANAKLDLATIEKLRGHNVALLGDNDRAGKGFARDIVRLLASHGITAIAQSLPDGANDLNDVLRQKRGLT
jgi:DNA primase